MRTAKRTVVLRFIGRNTCYEYVIHHSVQHSRSASRGKRTQMVGSTRRLRDPQMCRVHTIQWIVSGHTEHGLWFFCLHRSVIQRSASFTDRDEWSLRLHVRCGRVLAVYSIVRDDLTLYCCGLPAVMDSFITADSRDHVDWTLTIYFVVSVRLTVRINGKSHLGWNMMFTSDLFYFIFMWFLTKLCRTHFGSFAIVFTARCT